MVTPYLELGDFTSPRNSYEGTLHCIHVQAQPLADTGLGVFLEVFFNHKHLLTLGTNADYVTGAKAVGRNAHTLSIHKNVTMVYELSCLVAAGCKVEAEHHIVEPLLQKHDQILTGLTGNSCSFVEGQLELLLEHAISSLQFLLFAQLQAVIGRLLGTCAGILARKAGGLYIVHRALAAVATLSLEEQLGPLSSAISALRSSISCHVSAISSSDSSTLARSACGGWG